MVGYQSQPGLKQVEGCKVASDTCEVNYLIRASYAQECTLVLLQAQIEIIIFVLLYRYRANFLFDLFPLDIRPLG